MLLTPSPVVSANLLITQITIEFTAIRKTLSIRRSRILYLYFSKIKWAINGVKVKKSPENTAASDPLTLSFPKTIPLFRIAEQSNSNTELITHKLKNLTILLWSICIVYTSG